jgi:hypothetical protein
MPISFVDGCTASRAGKPLSMDLIWRKRRVPPV